MKSCPRLQPLLDELSDNVNRSIYLNMGSSGARYYCLATEKEYYTKYMRNGSKCSGCEIIVRDKPCHLHIDLDVDKIKYPSIDVSLVWIKLEPRIEEFISSAGLKIEETCLHFSCGEKKGSMHIVIKIKDRIFANNAHVGAFMRCVQWLIEEEHPELQYLYDRKFIDMAIYTTNRAFRMLGHAKWGTNRYLTDGNTLTLEHWISNKVQPVQTDRKIINGIVEPDQSQPCYRGSRNGVVGYIPGCLQPVLKYIGDDISEVTRVYCPDLLSMVFACNLKTKDCPFKGEAHSKNTLYTCINLKTKTYRIKCHSNHCRDRESDPIHIPDFLHGEIDGMMMTPVVIAGYH